MTNNVNVVFISLFIFTWGFFGHQKINRTAVFTLPPEMISFYKYHIDYITENSIDPDKRRYANPYEGARHYIDLELYGDSSLFKLPRYFSDISILYSEDSLNEMGIVPWHVEKMKNYLTKAFLNQDTKQILKLSAELGHYIADANVPLHTTENYNGQLTGQRGIHGFWESRLPELYADSYDLFTGKAEYITNTQLCIWKSIVKSNQALDSVLTIEKSLSQIFSGSKYSIEERKGRTVRVYSKEFSKEYHRQLKGMVERQMRSSIKMIGDFWFTCWVDGGQPDLSTMLSEVSVDERVSKRTNENQKNTRDH